MRLLERLALFGPADSQMGYQACDLYTLNLLACRELDGEETRRRLEHARPPPRTRGASHHVAPPDGRTLLLVLD